VYTHFINVTASLILHPVGAQVVEPWGRIYFIDLVTDCFLQEFQNSGKLCQRRSRNDAEAYRMSCGKFFNLLEWTEESRYAFE